jgi:hypothetical protein
MATESVRGVRRPAVARRATDETKASFKTTEFYAAVVLVAAILIAAAVSDTLDDVRAWTLVTAVGIGYMLSRGLASPGRSTPVARTCSAAIPFAETTSALRTAPRTQPGRRRAGLRPSCVQFGGR